ncbi:hypothetical protein BO82DRAFT_158516 [Aspergillus uvarum CBS 121591]|uniref:Uncharacterized protein n=1 Tax=Aspergillus uvarum CBS 121591 TaxID=1448315 RepID=A0A319DEX7_9EURO|nr:hypothetical protein BO82DRAFT_158516 [Aspergillus uvarum CBS 121591]PYH78362.1 hypothetical protein BO82DRAFT_158516 [Aspergillus uvarum CBS 121591]
MGFAWSLLIVDDILSWLFCLFSFSYSASPSYLSIGSFTLLGWVTVIYGCMVFKSDRYVY